MTRSAAPVWLSLFVAVPGCFSATESPLLPASPFPGAAASSRFPQPPAVPAATTEASLNVARIGQKVVSANPAFTQEVRFYTIGGASAPFELYHRGESDIYITETLARQCKNDGELAALLSVELGRIANERAAKAIVSIPDPGPPPAVSVGNDFGGSFGAADGTRMMELAKYERKRTIARERVAPPDPDVLARSYLQAAGYKPGDVDAVASLLRSADGNAKLERLPAVSPVK